MSKDLTPKNSFELVEGPDDRGPTGGVSAPLEHRPNLGGIEDEEGGSGLSRYLAAVLRYKWWIILVTLIGTAAGFGAAEYVDPVYQARATLWIETASPQADRTGPIRPQELLESSSWIELLRSATVLEPVVRELNLFVRPGEESDAALLSGIDFEDRFATGRYRLRTDPVKQAYTLESAEGEIIERGSYGDSVGRDLGLRWAPNLATFPHDRPVRFTLASPREVANAIGNDLQAELDRNGNFLRLTMEEENPQRVAAVLNAITERYVTVAADLKRARLDELVSILEEQLEYSEQRLRESEIALEDFRVETVTLPSDRSTPVAPGLQITRDPVFGNFFDMRVELEQVRRERDVIERAIAPDSDARIEVLRSVAAVQQSPEMTTALQELTDKRSELRALRYRYTDDHPPVRRLLNEIQVLERQTIPVVAQGLLTELSAQERQLEERIASASTEMESIPPRTIEEARLTRSVESADNLYTTLLRRHEEARLSAASSIPDVRVLDEAVVPRQPIRNQKPQLIFLAMMGSLGLGILGAVLRDRTDRRLHYPDQVTAEMGLAILGGIPRLRSRRGPFGTDNRSQAQEAFRGLRLSVMHAYGAAGPLVTTVTSPGPGDGKSFVSANLARAFADIGRRTLLVDGDTRRGELHALFDLDRKPGLIDLLRDGESTAQGMAKATSHQNLFLLPSGARVKKGPELLSSSRMRDLILGLRSKFDVIIVDSPPLGAGVDPFVLGTLTGSMLLVLRTGETDREMAEAKLELLDRLPVRLLGAVLNGVPATREYRYYSYSSGYESWSEEEVPAPALLQEGRA